MSTWTEFDRPAVQTRDDLGDLEYFSTLAAAIDYGKIHPNVWKISFSIGSGERVRLIRNEDTTYPWNEWVYEPIKLEGT
jgi:hypothetical protein